MSNQFDSKSFNAEAFGFMVDRVPNLQTNEIIKSAALQPNADIQNAFKNTDGTGYARLARRDVLTGDAQNYDGDTDIDADVTKTFEQGVVVVGRAKAWVERDFSYDITGQTDFMQSIADHVAEYTDELDQKTLLAVLEGIFNMSGGANNDFVQNHTTELTGNLDATTLNSALNKACGAHKKKFAVVLMHSDVATNLENLNLVERLKYTDADGISRDIELGTWNGKLLIIDDRLPVDKSGATPKYTSYALGKGAFGFENIGAKVPYEMYRDPRVNGGEDTLYMRQRKVFAPFCISYEKKNQMTLSPTDDELKDGANWTLCHSGETNPANRTVVSDKVIPIVRIVSEG